MGESDVAVAVDRHELKELAPTSAIRDPFNHDWGVELPTAVVY